MNVWAPSNASLLPVMVFIHGGRFEQGGTGTPLYDGTNIATIQDIVIVTVQYRIGESCGVVIKAVVLVLMMLT